MEISEHLEQVGLEGLVCTVEFVDEQNRRARRVGLQGMQQGPFDQETLREHVVAEPFSVTDAFCLGHADLDHLGSIVPLVHRRGDVEALVTL